MMYITHDGSVITGVFSGTTLPEGAELVPYSFSGGTGMAIKMFDVNWQKRPVPELLTEGLLTMPEGFVWDEDKNGWRNATEAELVADGRRELGEREIIDGDFVRDMTPEELYERGLLTEEERRTWRQHVIMARLDDIDLAAVRPLRAILAEKDTEYDRQKLTDLEVEAETLRAELADLGG